MKTEIAERRELLPDVLRQTRKSEIPIRAYNVVHTGAKIQFGGAMFGLRKPAYHPGIEGIVNREPTTPATSQNTTNKISSTALLVFWCVAYSSTS